MKPPETWNKCQCFKSWLLQEILTNMTSAGQETVGHKQFTFPEWVRTMSWHGAAGNDMKNNRKSFYGCVSSDRETKMWIHCWTRQVSWMNNMENSEVLSILFASVFTVIVCSWLPVSGGRAWKIKILPADGHAGVSYIKWTYTDPWDRMGGSSDWHKEENSL